ncbi:MAG: fumarylacetoacetate hydrolase family protein [Microbacterium sp.]
MSQCWSIVQFVAAGGEPRVGILADGRLRVLPADWPRTALDLYQAWAEWAPRLRALDVDALEEVFAARLAPPITYPRKVLCAGANYYDHAAEMGATRPDPAAEPFFFLKPPTTAIVGPGDTVVVPRADTAGLDWEVELAVVIGVRARDVDAADAGRIIAGYTVANDISARARFARSDAVHPPFAWDWLAHKAFDGSCPLGPGVVPEWQLPDPHDLRLRLQVNGVTKQDSSTRELVVGIGGLIAAASRHVTLEPGDVILTGTPAGVGMPKGDFLRPGDTVVAEIDGIGRLENTIASAP